MAFTLYGYGLTGGSSKHNILDTFSVRWSIHFSKQCHRPLKCPTKCLFNDYSQISYYSPTLWCLLHVNARVILCYPKWSVHCSTTTYQQYVVLIIDNCALLSTFDPLCLLLALWLLPLLPRCKVIQGLTQQQCKLQH